MKLPISMLILVTVLSTTADARVTRKQESEYLDDAKHLGACNAEDVFQTLENIYSYCDASDGQFDKLYNAYDSGTKCDANTPALINANYQLMINFNMVEC